MEFIAANMAPLMFGSLVIFLLFGYPVAFALAANGVVFGLIGIELGLLTPARAGRNRVYTQRDRTRLKLTLRGKRLGLSLQRRALQRRDGGFMFIGFTAVTEHRRRERQHRAHG